MARFLFLVTAAPLLLAAAGLSDQERYAACTALVKQNAAAAFSEGLDWVDQGGGVAARHCSALALSAMGKDQAAAELFLEAADGASAGKGIQLEGMDMTPSTHAQIYAQAGHSFILAGQGANAVGAFTQAISLLQPRSWQGAQLRIDRARALALDGDFERAFADLTEAGSVIPEDADLLLYRAAAARQTGRLQDARADIAKLTALRPDLPAAWLESAQIARAQGQPTLARKHLLRAIELDDNGPITDVARYMLEALALDLDAP